MEPETGTNACATWHRPPGLCLVSMGEIYRDYLMLPQPGRTERVQPDMGGLAATLDYDAELMVRVKEGDGASFAVLLGKHRSPVIHFLYRMVQNQAVAEELAQEVFLRVYRSRGTYEPTAKFTTWLFRIATHLALNSLRDGRNERLQDSLDSDSGEPGQRQLSDRQPSAEAVMVNEVRMEEIRQAVAGLPEKQRAAVLMHKYQEMEYSQIAKILNCSESAVKSLLFRAYETLRARLAHMA
jgi:RNA polymerase sigma-70 factor (ECF subfamily)